MKEVWDLYISLYAHENVAVRIGTLGVSLTALSFLITFILKPTYLKLKSATGKIKVAHSINQQLIQSYGLQQNVVTAGDPIFTAIVTNTDNRVRYVNSINIKASRKVNGFNMWSVPNLNGKFPIRLEPGQQFKHDFSISDLTSDVFRQLRPYDKVQFLVSETSGKKYYSGKVKVKQLTMQLGVARNFNARR